MIECLYQVVIGQVKHVIQGIASFPVGMGNSDNVIIGSQKVEDMLLLVQVLHQRIIHPQHPAGANEDLVFLAYAKSVFISRDVKGRVFERFIDRLVIGYLRRVVTQCLVGIIKGVVAVAAAAGQSAPGPGMKMEVGLAPMCAVHPGIRVINLFS